jgi:hypothetical protein
MEVLSNASKTEVQLALAAALAFPAAVVLGGKLTITLDDAIWRRSSTGCAASRGSRALFMKPAIVLGIVTGTQFLLMPPALRMRGATVDSGANPNGFAPVIMHKAFVPESGSKDE